jgi:hypothetical protein
LGGEPGAEIARSEQPQRRQLGIDRHRPDRPERVIGRECRVVEGQQLGQQLGVVITGQRLGGTAHSERGDGIRARSAAKSQVDPSRMQRLQQAERLGDPQRCVIGEHHPTSAHSQAGGAAGNVLDHDFRGATGKPRRVVMLGVPDPVIAESIGQHRKIHRGLHGRTGGRAGNNRRQIEQGQRTKHGRSFRGKWNHLQT